MDKKENNIGVLTILRNLEIGESHKFPAARASYVKSACTTFGFEWNKKFTTTVNRPERTIIVSRVE